MIAVIIIITITTTNTIITITFVIIFAIITWNGMLGSSACSSTSRGTTLAGAPAIISRQEAARALSR